MPAASPAASLFGSPARQPPSAFTAAPPLPMVPGAAAPAAAPLGPAAPRPAAAAAGFLGSFSPSDASSIESTDADDLLAALHGQAGRPHLGSGAAAAGLLAGHTTVGPHVSVAATALPHLAAAATDADGIDDVLRLQPWLHE